MLYILSYLNYEKKIYICPIRNEYYRDMKINKYVLVTYNLMCLFYEYQCNKTSLFIQIPGKGVPVVQNNIRAIEHLIIPLLDIAMLTDIP